MYSKKILIESVIGKSTSLKYMDKVHQSDKDIVVLEVELKNQDNTKVELDNTHLVSFLFVDSKNRLHQHNADDFVSGNAVLTLPQELILTGGTVKMEIRFSKEGKILGTNSINFPIDQTTISSSLIVGSQPSFDIMSKMIELYTLYENGEFSSGTGGGNQIQYGTELIPSGLQTFSQTSATIRIRIPVDTSLYKQVTAGKKVRLTFEAMSDVANVGANIYIYDSINDVLGSTEPSILVGNTWSQFAIDLVVQPDLSTATNLQLTFAVNTQSTFSVRNISLKEDLTVVSGSESIDWDTVDDFIFERNRIGNFTPQSIPNRDSASGVNSLASLNHIGLYSLYDNLMNQYPSEITKTLLGNDSGGLPVYRYDFKPKQAVIKPNNNYSIKTPKILVVSGQHGAERLGVINVFNAMNHIYNHPNTSPILENLRQNAHIIIIPLATPWGFNNNTRVNFNGVDLNRNYPHTWSSGTVGSQTYGGTAPLNQVESQYISNIIINEKNLVSLIDVHNFFEADNNWENIWIIGTNPLTVNIANSVIKKLNYKWITEKPFLGLSDRARMIGDIDSPSNGGYLDNYGASKGLVSLTFECQNKSLLAPNTLPFSSEIQAIGVEGIVNIIQACMEKGVELS